MAIASSWLIGSFVLTTNATLVVNGNNKTIAAGTYYLRDASSARSLIDAIEDAIQTEVATATVFIGQDRKLRIDGNGNVITLGVPASLQAVLGLPASPTAGTTVTATSVSSLLWSPGWPETSNGHPSGTEGREVYDRIVTSSASGLNVNVTYHNTQTIGSWSWTAVKQSRVWTTSESPGEFHSWRQTVLLPGRRFKLYPQIIEDESSSSAVTWSTALGPYICHSLPDDWYRRFIEQSDSIGANIELEGIKTAEIS